MRRRGSRPAGSGPCERRRPGRACPCRATPTQRRRGVVHGTPRPNRSARRHQPDEQRRPGLDGPSLVPARDDLGHRLPADILVLQGAYVAVGSDGTAGRQDRRGGVDVAGLRDVDPGVPGRPPAQGRRDRLAGRPAGWRAGLPRRPRAHSLRNRGGGNLRPAPGRDLDVSGRAVLARPGRARGLQGRVDHGGRGGARWHRGRRRHRLGPPGDLVLSGRPGLDQRGAAGRRVPPRRVLRPDRLPGQVGPDRADRPREARVLHRQRLEGAQGGGLVLGGREGPGRARASSRRPRRRSSSPSPAPTGSPRADLAGPGCRPTAARGGRTQATRRPSPWQATASG